MTLETLVILVVTGVTAVVIAVRFSGISRRVTIADARQAKAVFAQHYPDELPGECLCTSDGKAAFLTLPGGRIGLVSGFGARYVCRLFEKDEVHLRHIANGVVKLRFSDFGYPGGTYRFARTGDARKLVGWLEGDVNGSVRSRIS
jgi:hypothetical protein